MSRWSTNTLELRCMPFTLWDPNEEFDFDVIDAPQELEQLAAPERRPERQRASPQASAGGGRTRSPTARSFPT